MALKDKLMTLEDFKAVRDVDVASNQAQFTEINESLGAQVPQLNLLNAIQNSKGFGKDDSNVYFADADGEIGIILRDGFDSANADIKMFYHPKYKNGVVIDGDGNVLGELSPVGSLAGLKLSILGDSISTYSGYIPSGYATYYPQGDVDNVSKTWWHKLLDMSGMVLLKNASWSGSMVSGDTSLTTGQTGCSDARINALKDGDTKPDIIICYISTNDWAHNVSVGTYDSTEDVDLTTQVISNISDAYAIMLYKIRNAYPDAHMYCVTSLEGRRTSGDTSYPILNTNNESIHQANHAIAEIAHIFGAKVIDLQACGIHYWNVSNYTVDGTLHPNDAGTTVIANTIYKELKQDFV